MKLDRTKPKITEISCQTFALSFFFLQNSKGAKNAFGVHIWLKHSIKTTWCMKILANLSRWNWKITLWLPFEKTFELFKYLKKKENIRMKTYKMIAKTATINKFWNFSKKNIRIIDIFNFQMQCIELIIVNQTNWFIWAHLKNWWNLFWPI